MKRCPRCKGKKLHSAFNKAANHPDGLQTYCRDCSKIYGKEAYAKNPKAYHARMRKRRQGFRKRVIEYLKTHPCVDCGESNPVVLEFDHRDGEKKVDAVGTLVGSSKCVWVKIQKEMTKCDVRCANCHRIRTAKQQNWYAYIEEI